jgi:peptidoglycan/LPS O-acetylase OafA/YrhL
MYTLVAVLFLSLVIRILAFSNGPTDNSALNDLLWSYRFFPFEIAMFLAGSLAHRIFAQLPDRLMRLMTKPEVYFLSVLGMIGGLCYFRLLLLYLGEVAYWLYYAIAFIGIMALFLHTKTSERDTYIGELSYPMYISHIPVLWLVGHFCKSEHTIYIVIPATLLVSMILSKLQVFVDKFRHGLVIARSNPTVHSQIN